jgi:hypothetical protein
LTHWRASVSLSGAVKWNYYILLKNFDSYILAIRVKITIGIPISANR